MTCTSQVYVMIFFHFLHALCADDMIADLFTHGLVLDWSSMHTHWADLSGGAAL